MTLAHALLSAEMETDGDIILKNDKAPAQKLVLCAVALTAGLIGSGATWVASQYDRPITKSDSIELEALTLYIAHARNLDENELRKKIENQYDVRRYTELTSTEAALAKRELASMAP